MRQELRPGLFVDSGVLQPECVDPSKQQIWEKRWKERLISALPAQLKDSPCQNSTVLGTGYYAPFQAMKAWAEIASSCAALRVVPQNDFFHFFFELIARHAVFTKRTHVNRVGWRADCLSGMLRKLERAHKGDGVDTRQHLEHFVSGLIKACFTPPTGDVEIPLLKAYFGRDSDKRLLAKTAVEFAKTDFREGCARFPSFLNDLWVLSHYVQRPEPQTDTPKWLPEVALWLDLKLQSKLVSELIGEKLRPIYHRVCSFLFHVGDRNWCGSADAALDLLSWHQSLVKMRAAKIAQLASHGRRPSAAQRRASKHCVALKKDVFKDAEHPKDLGERIGRSLSFRRLMEERAKPRNAL